MRRSLILSLLLLASCGDPVRDDHFANQIEAPEAAPQAQTASAVAVRVGELGPNFDACAAAGTTRHLAAGAQLPVRAAPFENAADAGAVPDGARFFVCSRSHDQKWLGIVFHENGSLDASCGVSGPLPARRAYDGPCRSGWVASAFVRLTAGIEQSPTNQRPAAREGA